MTGNTSRVRGRERELKVVRHYRVLGFVAYRLHEGSADVAALKAGHLPKLIQVKSTLRPYDHFRRADRDALIHDALSAGAEPVLAWWPKGGPLRLIPACEWPSRSAVRFPQAAAA